MTKSERTRQFIIEKAAPLFNKKGIAGTSMSDIMEATKLAKGGLYGNFSSKEELSVEAFCYLSDRNNATVRQRISEVSSFRHKLFALLEFYENRVLNPEYGGCPIMNFGAEADDTNPVIKSKVNQSIVRFQGLIRQVLEDGQKAGEISPEMDAEEFAVKAFTMIEGGILISKVQGHNRHLILVTNILKKEIDQNVI